MSYTLAPHIAALCPDTATSTSNANTLSAYGLIDRGQLATRHRRRLDILLQDTLHVPLYENTFAKAALDLSPVLLALPKDSEARRGRILDLDAVCKDRPILSILYSPATLQELLAHLQARLLIEADGIPYLLRLGDTQMLEAFNAVLKPEQRRHFFAQIHAWLFADCFGRLNDMAQTASREPESEPLCSPLALDTHQTNSLLDAAAVHTFASQLRKLDAQFDQRLDHANQARFVTTCLVTAREAGIHDETALLARMLEQWRREQSHNALDEVKN